MTSFSLLKEPLLVEAGGAGLERGRRHAVIGTVQRLDALMALRVVQRSILKMQKYERTEMNSSVPEERQKCVAKSLKREEKKRFVSK